jgi:hypothetical protein
MHRSNEAMICIGNSIKNSYMSVVLVAKPKNIGVFAFTYVCVGKFFRFMAISAWIYKVLTTMKRKMLHRFNF